MGNLNSRVGNNPTRWWNVIGRYDKEVQNDNGERLLNICVADNFVIANTKFPHERKVTSSKA